MIHNDENKSFAAFNNQGQRMATRDYILYLNDDIEAFPGWLEPLIETLDRNPQGRRRGLAAALPGRPDPARRQDVPART